jgi:hypothetical protein
VWTVSSRFEQTIPLGHTLTTSITCTPPGGSPIALALSAGSWSGQSGQLIRRTAAITVDGGSQVHDLLSTPGAVVQVLHGFQWEGLSRELIPVITGELSSAATTAGDGTVTASIADLGQRVQRVGFPAAFTPDPAARRRDVLAQVISDAVPDVTITNSSSDTGLIGVAQAFTSRSDLVSSLLTDGGAEGFFLPDGTFTIRDVPQLTDQYAWLIKPGPGGTLKSLQRTRPLDKLYNAVRVTPSSADGSQTWDSVLVQITDPNDPRHPSKIGLSIKDYQSPTVLTLDEAVAVGQVILSKVTGNTESLALGSVSHPGLDAGDIVRVVATTDDGPTFITHLVDSFSGDLATGEMTLATRSAWDLSS